MATKFYSCDCKKGMLPYGNVGKERVKNLELRAEGSLKRACIAKL